MLEHIHRLADNRLLAALSLGREAQRRGSVHTGAQSSGPHSAPDLFLDPLAGLLSEEGGGVGGNVPPWGSEGGEGMFNQCPRQRAALQMRENTGRSGETKAGKGL